jgi:hypothetical protein
MLSLLALVLASDTSAPKTQPLPNYATVESINRAVDHYKKLSNWVTDMGYHYGHLCPSLVLMVNNDKQVVGMEQTFPTTLPYQAWMDPKTTEFNAGRAQYSQHLMFVPASSVTPSMSTTLSSDLTSFDAFKKVNGSHVIPYSQITAFKPGVGSIWGPDGPALRIILSRHERVVGGIMAVPSKYGWNPWYDQRPGHPKQDPILGSVYTQTVYFVPPSSLK